MRLRLKHYGSDLMSTHVRNDVAASDVTHALGASAAERLMTVSELAVRLRYSPGWVRSQVRAGEIPCIKFNSGTCGSILANQSEVRRLAIVGDGGL
jgi:hypothetical protein